MAARKTAVPGEVEVKTETPQASTEPTTPDTKGDDQSTNETSSASELVTEPTNAELLEIINGLKAQIADQGEAKASQSVSVGGKLTDKGWIV